MFLTVRRRIERINDILGGAEVSLALDGSRNTTMWRVYANGTQIGTGDYPENALADAERAARRLAFKQNTEEK